MMTFSTSTQAAPVYHGVLYLHVFVFDLLAGGDAVGDVQVDELWRQVYSCGQPADINRIDFTVCSISEQTTNGF